MSMTSKTAAVLTALRARKESTSLDAQGREWGCVYLDNARPDGMSARSFAGHLSALTVLGFYKGCGDDCFGDVLLTD